MHKVTSEQCLILLTSFFVIYFVVRKLIILFENLVHKKVFLHSILSSNFIPSRPEDGEWINQEYIIDNHKITFKVPPERRHPKLENRRPHDNDLSDQFEKNAEEKPRKKRIAQFDWVYHGSKFGCIAHVRLKSSIQNMSACAPLTNIDNFFKAVQREVFSSFNIPDAEPWNDSSPPYSTHISQIQSFYQKGRPYIAYQYDKPSDTDDTNLFVHTVLEDDLMLTLEISSREFKNSAIAAGFVNRLIHCCSIAKPLKGVKENNNLQLFSDEKLSQLQTSEFDIEFLTANEFTLFLRRHAKDPLAWFVFENSPNYKGWFNAQLEAHKRIYTQKRQNYIDAMLINKKHSAENLINE